MKPLRPPILHRLEARRAGRPDDRGGLDLMFWAVVAVAIGLAYAICVWGGR